ncbi:hypothetical protein CC85DRAFT_316723 [Cutaneotrichosporon oleaginosum]|uniref:Uncharacterized protein n=1 Tax=Cutaneotrichosporon oleaginosum TaxID=879819 RepID=A0A0J0XRH8_9TREE|nr:uncharacterized protein CC85DRAFT_316723 [Cutaneotrichosporon oleaginosum]KLT43672.1 hypothetical protein CC85DRAFT_316723 [Cutaneotrichosporon oleaginosum]TXT12664.1 hypothetical protein COLE_03074 [Cutaneotrichosporon oleaginosum]
MVYETALRLRHRGGAFLLLLLKNIRMIIAEIVLPPVTAAAMLCSGLLFSWRGESPMLCLILSIVIFLSGLSWTMLLLALLYIRLSDFFLPYAGMGFPRRAKFYKWGYTCLGGLIITINCAAGWLLGYFAIHQKLKENLSKWHLALGLCYGLIFLCSGALTCWLARLLICHHKECSPHCDGLSRRWACKLRLAALPRDENELPVDWYVCPEQSVETPVNSP